MAAGSQYKERLCKDLPKLEHDGEDPSELPTEFLKWLEDSERGLDALLIKGSSLKSSALRHLEDSDLEQLAGLTDMSRGKRGKRV